MKLWDGRFTEPMAKDADAFNESLSFDKQLYRTDVKASIAHATMLGECEIISEEEAKTICDGLNEILADIESGKLAIEGAEDIHSFMESELVKRIGDTGKKLHTARSRNDQVATDMRLYVRDSIDRAMRLIWELTNVIADRAQEGLSYIMPGFTHLRKAQPIRLGQYFLAYAEMFLRDIDRFDALKKRMNVMPLGSAALAGTSYPIDRDLTRKLLKFNSVSPNALDAVSDRDFIAEYIFNASLVMMHLSRLCEDTILYTSDEFRYWVIPDEYSTGSSIMPQKKNPDLPELVRGKTGRVYGHLAGILATLKGLPLAYNKDLQEDKECFFDTEKTLFSCVRIYTALLDKITFNVGIMFDAAGKGFSTATDVADYLAKKGVPFRDAHAITGKLVRHCIEQGTTLDKLSVETYQKMSPVFGEDILEAVTVLASAEGRAVDGGSARAAVRKELIAVRKQLKKYF